MRLPLDEGTRLRPEGRGSATAVILRSEVRRSRTERQRISIPRQTPRLTVPRDSLRHRSGQASLPLVAQNDRREVDAAPFRARSRPSSRRRYFEMV
jgi:hypothetical protein